MQAHHREHGGGKGKTLWVTGQMYDSLIRHPAHWPARGHCGEGQGAGNGLRQLPHWQFLGRNTSACPAR